MSNHRTGWMLSLVALLVTGWFSAARASDKQTTVYSGTLGNQAVVFDLGGGNDERPGNYYFYMRYHRDLALVGKTGTDHLVLREGWIGGDSRPLITLDRQTDGSWRGSWQGAKGKTLPIVLHPAKPARPAADALPWLKQLYTSNTYEYLRLTKLKLQAGKRERFMNHMLQWWRVPGAPIAFFEILDGYRDAERQRINRVLMDRLWRETGAYYDCIEGFGYDSNTYDETVTPRLLTHNLVSLSVLISYKCHGSASDSYAAAINLDARTAQPLTLEDILWVGKGKPLHYVEGNDTDSQNSSVFDAYLNYRGNEFSPWLIRQWKRLYPNQILPAKGYDNCHYGEFYAWQYANWYMIPKGIFVIPSFGHADRVCQINDEWSLLPWAIVRKHPGRLELALPQ